MKISKWSFVIITSVFLFGCGKKEIVGTEKVLSQVRSVSPFSELDVSGFYDIRITVGAPQSVTISANGNLLPYITSSVSSKTLTVIAKKGYLLRPTVSPTINIVTPEIKQINCHGNNQVTLQRIAQSDLNVRLDGSNQFTAVGTVDNLTLKLEGEAIIDTTKLVANDVDIQTSGSTKINVYAKNSLNVDISGIATVNYIGNPKISQVINGSGKIAKLPDIINK